MFLSKSLFLITLSIVSVPLMIISLRYTFIYDKLMSPPYKPYSAKKGNSAHNSNASSRTINMIMEPDANEKIMCEVPRLPIWVPQLAWLKNKLTYMPKIRRCGASDWTSTKGGTFFIKDSENTENISCNVEYLDFKTDLKVKYHPANPIFNGSQLENPYMRVRCKNDKGAGYSNFHAAAAKLNFSDIPHEEVNEDKLNVYLLYFDSVSRPHWHRLLPKTHEYVLKELGGIELVSHNVLGDGTAASVIPLLTGYNNDGYGDELNCTHRANKKCTATVDGHPFLWKSLRKQGYIPLYAEDHPGLWVYLRKGFKRKPMEHYMRPFFTAAPYNCVGERTTLQATLNYFKDAIQTYNPRPVFAYHHNSNLAHDKLTDLKLEDTSIVAYLKQIKLEGILNKTLLIMASDHGKKYNELRNLPHGRFEEYLPYAAVILPQWFRVKHPRFHANLVRNAPLLSTTYDLRETILHVTNISGYKRTSKRGYSLFERIPKNRTCVEAAILTAYCTCLKWNNVKLTDPVVKKASKIALDQINEFTKEIRSKCKLHKLKKLLMARVARNPAGRKHDIYQLVLVTSPAGARYEVVLHYHEVKDKLVVRGPEQIARTNSYAKMVDCLTDSETYLSKFCVCKNAQLPRDLKEAQCLHSGCLSEE